MPAKQTDNSAGNSTPIAVVTGALGSGKTTVIRALMARPEMAGTALVINEFGEVGLDHLLVSSAVETTLLMENGCMCCSLRGDLVDTIMGLFSAVERKEIPPFRRILIETTGLADPVPILRDITLAPVLRDRVHLTGVATCVDGLIGRAGLTADPVANAQVAQADTCLVTKTDLADPLALDQLCEALRVLNPMMALHKVNEGALPPHDFLFAGPSADAPRLSQTTPHDHHHDAPHSGIDSWSTLIDAPLPWEPIRDWLDLIYSLNAARMLRMKGILWIEERSKPLLVQAVGPVVTPLQLLDEWPPGPRQSRLVLIFKGLDREALATSFEHSVLQHLLKVG